MNPAQLLEHFDRISEAPGAVARLRRFILDLAVRGKLVEQDPDDEPAAELLKRIQAERARLVKEGAIRKQTALTSVSTDEQPFDLPKNWCWSRFAEIADFSAGRTPSRHDLSFWNTGEHPWVSIADMKDGATVFSTKETVSEKAKTQVFGSEPAAVGTLIMSFKLTIGKIARLGVPAFHNEAIISIRPHFPELDDYLFKVLPQFSRQGDTKDAIKGATLNRDSISNILLPLPPLAEQHRIVAKVDELMALCDQLEAAKNEREVRRDQLMAASLHRIDTAPSAADEAATEAQSATPLRDAAHFHLDHLPQLTTRPEHIKQLRQTILNLAVRGHLVRQYPNEEPIDVTLQTALERRAALVRTKKIRQKKLDDLAALIKRNDLPASWAVERLGNLVDPENTISYGVLVPGNEVADGVPFVRAQDLALNSHPVRPNKSIAPEIEKAYARTRLKGGEILLCVVGSIGKLGVVPPSWAGANIARAVARILPVPEVFREYLLVVLQAQPVQTYFTEATRTLAQPTLNVGLIEQAPIPLPPLAEQHRIVAKVNELMALCDQLEAQLITTQTDSRRLLEAVLHEALAPALEKAA